MTEVFFSGYGCWFVKHHRSGKIFEVCCPKGFNSDNFFLFPLHDREETECKGQFKTVGFFNLTAQDDFTYCHTNNMANVTRLNPSLSDSHTRSTFNDILDQIQIGAMPVDLEDCYFIIDKDQYFDLVVQDSCEHPKPEPLPHLVNTKNSFGNRALLNKPLKVDYWFIAIEAMTKEFYRDQGIIPNEVQAWGLLVDNPPKGYIIKGTEKNNETVLEMPGVKSLDRKNFIERWRKYTDSN